MKKRIIFVDDDPNILQGLQRTLRHQRNEWEMEFVCSGQEALERMKRRPFDVIVSDMRMPEMDGAQLLNKVMLRYPQMVRIVLSGHSDKEIILKSIRPAHQYLSKPCDPGDLISTVSRAFALREILTNDSLKQVVTQTDSLPSPPTLYSEILKELQKNNSSLKKVSGIISQDVGMTAKILQMVNSAFFGLARKISNPEQAVMLLGMETIKSLVLSIHIFSRFDEKKCKRFSLDQVRNHSLVVAMYARQIARQETEERMIIDDVFMAGLLHDAGKLVLANNFPQQYDRILQLSGERQIPVCEAEEEICGTTHAEIGAYLMGLWGLPDSIVEAIAFHHHPGKFPHRRFSPLTAVYAANLIEQEFNGNQDAPCVDNDYLAAIGKRNQLEQWKSICRNLKKMDGPYE